MTSSKSIRGSLLSPSLLPACLLLTTPALPGSAQTTVTKAEAIETSFAINDEDPESTVPTPEQAMKDPLQMGYLMMAFSDRAEAALAQGTPALAAKYYRAMGKAVPDRAVAFRKACKAHDAAGEIQKAVETCRAALGKGGVTIPDHLAFVHIMLKKPGPLGTAEIADIDAVLERLEGELKLGQEDKGRLVLAELRCQLGVRLTDAGRLSACTKELKELKVEKAKLLPYAWALAMSQHNLGEAESVMEQAEQAGLPGSAIEVMQKGLRRAVDAQQAETFQLAKRWWPAVVALALSLLAIAAVRSRRRSSLA